MKTFFSNFDNVRSIVTVVVICAAFWVMTQINNSSVELKAYTDSKVSTVENSFRSQLTDFQIRNQEEHKEILKTQQQIVLTITELSLQKATLSDHEIRIRAIEGKLK